MAAGAADVVYELTVAGCLGPVLRAVLDPVAATTTIECVTITCRTGPDGPDLVDLVQLLSERGLDALIVSAVR